MEHGGKKLVQNRKITIHDESTSDRLPVSDLLQHGLRRLNCVQTHRLPSPSLHKPTAKAVETGTNGKHSNSPPAGRAGGNSGTVIQKILSFGAENQSFRTLIGDATQIEKEQEKIRQFKRLIEVDGGNQPAHMIQKPHSMFQTRFKLALSLTNLKQYGLAYDEMSRALLLAPYIAHEYRAIALARFNRAVILRYLGRYDDAVLDLTKALKLCPNTAEILHNKALNLRQSGMGSYFMGWHGTS